MSHHSILRFCWPPDFSLPLLLGWVLAAGCSSEGGDAIDGTPLNSAGDFNPTGATNTTSPGAPGSVPGGGQAAPSDPSAEPPPPLPPEQEVSAEFELPHAGQRYVYVANPESDTVAVLDAETLAIHTVEAGDGPTFLQTLAGEDAAIVLNTLSADATIIRTAGGRSKATHIDVLPGSNAIAVSPDGQHAVAYFNAEFSTPGRATGSFQDVSVITLSDAGDSATGMTVGFEPSQVAFSADGENAFVVTKSGISVLNFARIEEQGSEIAYTIPFDNSAPADTQDVSITPDGRFALARRTNDTSLRLIDLTTEAVHVLDLAEKLKGLLLPTPDAGAPADAGADASPPPPATLPANLSVTDVDLSPSGGFAIAVVREAETVVRVPIPGAFTGSADVELIQVPGEVIGSVNVSPDENFALLYTTVVETNERVTLLKLNDTSRTLRTVDLKKAIRGVAISPDSQTALFLHTKRMGDPTAPGLSTDQIIDFSFGYSVMQLETAFPKLQVTETELGPFAIVPDGSYLFILFNDEGRKIREVHRVGLSNFLVDPIALGSPPVSVGAVPASKKVFVGQTHPDGRITFINWQTAEPQSVTGFELNSRIRE